MTVQDFYLTVGVIAALWIALNLAVGLLMWRGWIGNATITAAAVFGGVLGLLIGTILLFNVLLFGGAA